MKLVTEEEMKEFDAATWRGGLKGLGVGVGLSAGGHFLLQRSSLRYRALPLPAKAFGAMLVIVPSVVIVAERAGIAYDHQRYSKAYGYPVLTAAHEEERLRREKLSKGERALEWADKNKFSLIGASWAGSMAGAWMWISRDKYMTFSQKIVQVRMWAQGITIGVLIASALLSNAERQRRKARGITGKENAHSWMNQIHEIPPSTNVDPPPSAPIAGQEHTQA